VGVYGALTYTVRRRSRDLAIQVALGSARGRIARDVLRRAATLVGGGVAVGAVGAFALTRFMGSLLFEVSPLDPAAFASAALLLALVGLVGAWVPALRAARADPMRVLKE